MFGVVYIVFGLCLSVMGCYYGFNASNGAYGVGKSTTKAVVSSSILVLVVNSGMTTHKLVDH